jgi:hypothetical protein
VVAARHQLRRNLAASARKSIFENRRNGAVQKAIAVFLPEPIQGAEARSVETTVCTDEPCAVRGNRPFFHAPLLLEEPAQFVDVVQPKGHCELLSRSGFERRHVLRKMRGC